MAGEVERVDGADEPLTDNYDGKAVLQRLDEDFMKNLKDIL